MKVTSFTKQNLPEIRKQINAKLAELQSLGINFEIGNIKFQNESFHVKLECRIQGLPGVKVDVYADAFNKSFMSLNYKNALGTKVMFMNKEYIFKGFQPGARVKQAIIEINGKMYRVEFSAIAGQLVLFS